MSAENAVTEDAAAAAEAAAADAVAEGRSRGQAGRRAAGTAGDHVLAALVGGWSVCAWEDGTWLKISLPLVAIRFTGRSVLIAGLSFAVTLPWLLFALQAGALADRLDRRRAMLARTAPGPCCSSWS